MSRAIGSPWLSSYRAGCAAYGCSILGLLRNANAETFQNRLVGARFQVDILIQAPRRHGKWLMLPTDGPTHGRCGQRSKPVGFREPKPG